jgi:hypothetical protein
MEANMDKQPMLMHNTFWLENQVIVTFHSPTPLISTDGINNGGPILKQLNLEEQLQKLNGFLKENQIDFTLSFFDDKGITPVPSMSQTGTASDEQRGDSFTPPPGIYLFDLSNSEIVPTYGLVNTSIVSFFNLKSNKGVPSAITGMVSEAGALPGLSKDDDDDDNGGDSKNGPVARVVNTFNGNLQKLNQERQIPISAASPAWLCGATNGDHVIQGCPLTPPMPVDDSCSYWHYILPQLSPEELRSMTGEGVTVFILDTLPDREVISSAAEEAGDDNLLLLDVNKNVSFNYHIQSHGSPVPNLQLAFTGKDVYGRHFVEKIPDHGLFIAGIVHDIAPNARIECIRVLFENCLGDLDMLTQALQYIQNRMSQRGDLYQRPVVINMSLVIPTKEEAKSEGVDPDLGFPNNDVQTCIRQQMQSLVGLGAIFVASAGNEAEVGANPSGNRPEALYPANFANPPDSIDGIVPVGAVDHDGKATSYSCYPGPRGIATYGGEVPSVDPKDPDPNNPPIVTISDAVRGICSCDDFPPLSSDPPALEYPAPNDHAWAYWVGTSFATPIITAVAARILELKSKGVPIPNVHNAVIAAAGTGITKWDKLDPLTTGVTSGFADGPLLLAGQQCLSEDEDEEEVDIEVISVVEEGEEVDIEVIDVVVEE